MTSDTKQEMPLGGTSHKPHTRLLSIFSCSHCNSKTEVSTTLPETPEHHEAARRTHAGVISHFKNHLPKLHDHESISDRGPFRIEVDEQGHGHAVENNDWPPGIVPYEIPNRISKDQGLGPLAGKVIAPGGTGNVSYFQTQAVGSFDPNTTDRDREREDKGAHDSHAVGDME